MNNHSQNKYGSSYSTYPSRFNNNYNNNYRNRHVNLISSDDDDSSTHSVRVSRLIEKIKASQQRGSSSSSNIPNDAFSYMPSGVRASQQPRGNRSLYDDYDYSSSGSKGELIYSRVEGGGNKGSFGKRTVREVVPRNNLHNNNHKTTVLLNYDGDEDDNYIQDRSRHGDNKRGGNNNNLRYFGEDTDYEYDRVLSSKFKGNHNEDKQQLPRNQPPPKIILHEEAVADIPNGVIRSGSSVSRGRSPVGRDSEEVVRESGGSTGGKRFLGGFLTLKRGKDKRQQSSTIRSTHSPTPTTTQSSSKYLNVPTNSNHNQPRRNETDYSSSSPKYYVPYYRSTPTLYNERDSHHHRVGSSAGGSVLSNTGSSSYVGKHVTRSMSMKAPWEPKHKSNEINYYNEGSYNKKLDSPSSDHQKRGSTLKRSKSMPGKKLTSLIGNWVNKGTLKREGKGNLTRKQDADEEEESLIKNQKATSTSTIGRDKSPSQQQYSNSNKDRSNWGFTLLRFGKKKKDDKNKIGGRESVGQAPDGYHQHGSNHPIRPSRSNRTSVSPIRSYSQKQQPQSTSSGHHHHYSQTQHHHHHQRYGGSSSNRGSMEKSQQQQNRGTLLRDNRDSYY